VAHLDKLSNKRQEEKAKEKGGARRWAGRAQVARAVGTARPRADMPPGPLSLAA
jgi:hypothetical protein